MNEFYGVYTVLIQLLKNNRYFLLSSPVVNYNILTLFLRLEKV